MPHTWRIPRSRIGEAVETESFDAIVVGSGATGGWAAKELTSQGLRVAVLEAGPAVAADGHQGQQPVRPAPGRQPIQSQCYAFGDQTAHLFVDDVENAYSHPADSPFQWIRSRQVGGRLHLWTRMSVRMSDRELKAASHDGIGVDWPISYADLAPYYDRVERFMRVCGDRDGLSQLPDGRFLAPPLAVAGERDFKSAVEARWSTRRVTSARIAQSPPDAMLAAAMATGRMTLHQDSIASRVVDGQTHRSGAGRCLRRADFAARAGAARSGRGSLRIYDRVDPAPAQLSDIRPPRGPGQLLGNAWSLPDGSHLWHRGRWDGSRGTAW